MRFWILALIASAWPLTASAQDVPARQECVNFASHGRLTSGTKAVFPLPANLEVRLSPRSWGWDITVGPAGDTADYMWVMTPPYRTAPHRQIGAGYGLSAAQSAEMADREYKFVLTQADYQRALEIAENEPAGPQKSEMLEKLPAGTLALKVTGYTLSQRRDRSDRSEESDGLDWITLLGQACIPR